MFFLIFKKVKFFVALINDAHKRFLQPCSYEKKLWVSKRPFWFFLNYAFSDGQPKFSSQSTFYISIFFSLERAYEDARHQRVLLWNLSLFLFYIQSWMIQLWSSVLRSFADIVLVIVFSRIKSENLEKRTLWCLASWHDLSNKKILVYWICTDRKIWVGG